MSAVQSYGAWLFSSAYDAIDDVNRAIEDWKVTGGEAPDDTTFVRIIAVDVHPKAPGIEIVWFVDRDGMARWAESWRVRELG